MSLRMNKVKKPEINVPTFDLTKVDFLDKLGEGNLISLYSS